MSVGLGVNDRDDQVPPRLTPAMTSRRLLILVFVRDYIQRHGGSPSLREIANAIGTSPIQIKRHLDRLIEKGELVRTPGPRGLGLPTMLDAALRCLREHGILNDQDLMRAGHLRPAPPGVTEKQLLPPPVLTYHRSIERERGDGKRGNG